jgi:hypothetical protein
MFSCFFGATPPIKLKLHIHGRLLIPNHLGQSLWSTNEKYWAAIRCNLLHTFWEVHNCVAPFTSSHGKLHEFGAEKLTFWAKPAHFDFVAINFTVWSHILSTVGDALNTSIWVVAKLQMTSIHIAWCAWQQHG